MNWKLPRRACRAQVRDLKAEIRKKPEFLLNLRDYLVDFARVVADRALKLLRSANLQVIPDHFLPENIRRNAFLLNNAGHLP